MNNNNYFARRLYIFFKVNILLYTVYILRLYTYNVIIIKFTRQIVEKAMKVFIFRIRDGPQNILTKRESNVVVENFAGAKILVL